ncbi:MAG: signal peptidase I [Erysipelothrix sp.]|nr:signal peptidase I [Erysipelothrix sp.]
MKKDDKFILFLKDTMKTIVIYFVAIVLITQFVVRPFRVEGESMLPTIRDSEMGFSNILGVTFGGINRFDVVIVYIEASNKYLVKRVVGLPNETVEYRNDKLYIDGEEVEESFLDMAYVASMTDDHNTFFTTDFGPVVLGEDQYFLMGDNRVRSSDSRVYGPFDKSQIKSKNGFVFFPLNRIRFLGGDS